MTLCTEHFTCSIFGTTTAAVASAAAVVVLTLTHRYNAVRGHRTGSNNQYYYGGTINQDFIWCVKIGVYMGFWVYRGF